MRLLRDIRWKGRQYHEKSRKTETELLQPDRDGAGGISIFLYLSACAQYPFGGSVRVYHDPVYCIYGMYDLSGRLQDPFGEGVYFLQLAAGKTSVYRVCGDRCCDGGGISGRACDLQGFGVFFSDVHYHRGFHGGCGGDIHGPDPDAGRGFRQHAGKQETG